MNELATEQSPDDGLRELALFAGAGGGILGGKLLGWRTVCAVEIEPYPAGVLVARQNDGSLPPFPIWDDVRTFDGGPWRGIVDVVSGGFPCQDISSANVKAMGITGAKSGLWREMLRIIGEVEPEWVLAENSRNLRTRGLGLVLSGLAGLGYDVKWGVFSSASVGADHIRERMFVLGHSNRHGKSALSINDEASGLSQNVTSDSDRAQRQGGRVSGGTHAKHANFGGSNRRQDQPGLERVANGMANQMDRLRAIGNGQDCDVVRLAWETLKP